MKYNIYAIKTDYAKPELIGENLSEIEMGDLCGYAEGQEWETLVYPSDRDPNVIVVA